MTRPTVLVVDDKPNMLRLIAKILRDDATVETAPNGRSAIEVLKREPVDAVLCDLKMPDMDGLEVLTASKRLRPSAGFILMTAHASVDTAVRALREGAYDYLTKPFEPEHARRVILRAAGRSADGGGDTPSPEILPGVVARSSTMRELAVMVERVAASELSVVLLGETGTGKERFARAIHQLSNRRTERFVPVNCAAIPRELLESELFGHQRGSFTGATRDRVGLFEEAGRGTLFLDEIGEMDLPLQAKLTRALEERAIRRIGESNERKVDVRLVAATHRPLEQLVERGLFREDLWYRLNVAAVRIPPLRKRREDIELLAFHFLHESSVEPPIVGFTHAALETMLDAPWPGNVRQLRSAVELACVMTQDRRIDVGDLPEDLRMTLSGGEQDEAWADLDWATAQDRARTAAGRRYLEAVLRRCDGDVQRAASHAGVERESYYRLMRRFGVQKRPSSPSGDDTAAD